MTANSFQRPEVTSRYSTVQMIRDAGKLVMNVENIIDQATSSEYSNGLDWYYIASRQCQTIADHYGVTFSKVVGIVAALSPGCQWDKNILDAIAILEHGTSAVVSTYGANKSKALSILENGDVGVLGGRKVLSFYQNILNPHQDNKVTCDRHAANAAADWYQEHSPQKFLKGSKYSIIETAYFTAARARGIQGHQAQAIAWLVYKRIFSSKTDAVYSFPDWLNN